MSNLDWIVLLLTLFIITAYGIWKTRSQKNLNSYLLAGSKAKWHTIGLSVMATQASAITFLSTPGQAFDDGMRFVQFYFGLPIAMVIICITFIPIYNRLKVFTAYEFLEQRFGLNTRLFTAFLFLLQRGLAAGITIYAPAIVLSTVLGVSLNSMVLLIGGLVILYTVLGGTEAVNITQKYQMGIIFLGLFIAFGIIVSNLPEDISFTNALEIAGASGKMNILDFSFNLEDRYTFWTGIIGGSFLALSYFGTDQSQVQRYLTGASVQESRIGLLFNAFFKVPMQFFILLVGVLVFVFYQFNASPIHFNTKVMDEMYQTSAADEFRSLETSLTNLESRKGDVFREFVQAEEKTSSAATIKSIVQEERALRDQAKTLIGNTIPDAETNDKDFVFIHFILNQLPRGLIGLLLAVFFCAAMSSTASELNALGSTSLIDFYKRVFKKDEDETHYVHAAKGLTIMWGLVALAFASIASLFENLIQFVNIIGSLFYGTILGIFLVAFYLKKVSGKSVLIAAVITEITVIWIYRMDVVAYLWLNLIGCVLVVVLSLILETILKPSATK